MVVCDGRLCGLGQVTTNITPWWEMWERRPSSIIKVVMLAVRTLIMEHHTPRRP